QTVSMKSVGNLTDFVRAHMLEPSDVKARISGLINHFEDLTRAHDAVLTAKEQVAALVPLIKKLDSHDQLVQQAIDHRRLRDCLHGYFVVQKLALLAQRASRLRDDLRGHERRRSSVATEQASAQREENDLLGAIRDSGGDRLVQLEHEVEAAGLSRDRRRRAAQDYERLCAQVGLTPAVNDTELHEQHGQLTDLMESTDARRVQIGNELSEQAVAENDLCARLDRVDAELKGLAERDTNIDQRMIAIRGKLCSGLGLGEEQLPFAGELIRVTDERWEPAVERLLHGFGLSLLVPDRHYSQVSRWVDSTDLRGRLVYYRVRGRGQDRRGADDRSLVHKLEVKPGTAFTPWLESEVARRFDLLCARTAEEFAQATHALTRNGQIKSGGERHEKDDRHTLGDRRRYVLGWDNVAKRQALEAERSQITPQLARVRDLTRTLRAESSELDLGTRYIALLQERRDFTEFDWRAEVRRIEILESEARALRDASDILRELNNRLDAVRAVQQELAVRLTKVDQKVGAVTDRIKSDEAVADQLRAEASVEVDPTDGARLDELRAAETGPAGLTVENCEAVQQRIRGKLQTKIDNDALQANRLAERIVTEMGAFRTRWRLVSQELDTAVGAGGEYRALLATLQTDDLPRFEENFKRQLNENAIREVVGFRAALDTAQEDIRQRVRIVNSSLREIAYQPHTYIRLENTANPDADVRNFRGQLRACTEGSITGSGDDQYSEAKFLQVKEIVSRFQGREGRTEEDRRWTAKVTDVRNWFTFAASERLLADDSEHEHYSDSGGKSGGQKEKLAYTILAASLAYQFGLVSGETHARTFRFVVIDEAFGRGSDESARFGLELFKRLDLQLLVVTPLQKIHIIEPYVSHVGFVHTEGGTTSKLRNLTIEQYHEEKRAAVELRRAQATSG
ncbi:MAG: SbcC/MukB-like Walker B domain-containing protein, partial [Candidatus Nanopelagicales bacterium]|nr:SbcC/MukB-like Walker B domain-containing protein [Candidatus Nanopelagicales bacterium]